MSMAQPFAQHPPGMAVHGGHPMAQGHPSAQGLPGGQQPGVSMGPQMHAGVAGPSGPQVSQAGPMMGMMPGGGPAGVSGGPSAHAQAHLNPGHQGQMFAQNPKMHISTASLSQRRTSFYFSEPIDRVLSRSGAGQSGYSLRRMFSEIALLFIFAGRAYSLRPSL